jgi:hypothetical protein
VILLYGCEQGNVSKARLMEDSKKEEKAQIAYQKYKEVNETLELQ